VKTMPPAHTAAGPPVSATASVAKAGGGCPICTDSVRDSLEAERFESSVEQRKKAESLGALGEEIPAQGIVEQSQRVFPRPRRKLGASEEQTEFIFGRHFHAQVTSNDENVSQILARPRVMFSLTGRESGSTAGRKGLKGTTQCSTLRRQRDLKTAMQLEGCHAS